MDEVWNLDQVLKITQNAMLFNVHIQSKRVSDINSNHFCFYKFGEEKSNLK